MLPRHFIILLICVIAAAGFTIFIAQGLLTRGDAMIGSALVAAAMLLRVLLARR